jgi:hypothetical protein
MPVIIIPVLIRVYDIIPPAIEADDLSSLDVLYEVALCPCTDRKNKADDRYYRLTHTHAICI